MQVKWSVTLTDRLGPEILTVLEIKGHANTLKILLNFHVILGTTSKKYAKMCAARATLLFFLFH